jgi:hypothetical protein
MFTPQTKLYYYQNIPVYPMYYRNAAYCHFFIVRPPGSSNQSGFSDRKISNTLGAGQDEQKSFLKIYTVTYYDTLPSHPYKSQIRYTGLITSTGLK